MVRERIAELAQALRRLSRSPRFAAVGLATLGLGVAAAGSVFALVHGVLLSPLPYPEPNRLVTIESSAPSWGYPAIRTTSSGFYVWFRKEARTLTDVALFRTDQVGLATEEGAVRATSLGATPSLFSTLGVRPAVGRLYGEADQPRVALLTWSFWQTRFGGDPGVVGRTIQVDGFPIEVVGVTARGFRAPLVDRPDIIQPLSIDPATASTGSFAYRAVGRLAPGASPTSAEAELNGIVQHALDGQPGLSPALTKGGVVRAVVHGLAEREVGGVRTMLWVLFASTGLLLSIGCVNLTGLFLVRREARRGELAVRAALGGSAAQLRRVILDEGIVLGAAAGAPAALLAWWAVAALRLHLGGSIPRVEALTFGPLEVVLTLGTPILAGLLVGLVASGMPAGSLAALLTSGGEGRSSPSVGRLRRALVVGQVAMALVLLVGAGLMLRTASQLAAVQPGFQPEGLVTFRIGLPEGKYPQLTEAVSFQERFLDRLRALPGVEAAAATESFPLRDGLTSQPFVARDREPGAKGPADLVPVRAVSPGFFSAAGIPLLEGRAFTHADAAADAPSVVVVSRALAHRLWGERDAVGQAVRPEQGESWSTVVGVVGDTRDSGLEEPPSENLYTPLSSASGTVTGAGRSLTYVVRTEAPEGPLLEAVRARVAEMDPSVPVAGVLTGREILAAETTETRLTLLLLGLASAASLLLGTLGVFGVISYSTEQRSREIGIRLALGADAPRIRRMVLRESGGLVVLGAAVGTALALAGTPLMASLLFGVTVRDPATYAASAVVVVTAGMAAAWLPARRAAAADPAETLRVSGGG